jgi:hypothetical protein
VTCDSFLCRGWWWSVHTTVDSVSSRCQLGWGFNLTLREDFKLLAVLGGPPNKNSRNPSTESVVVPTFSKILKSIGPSQSPSHTTQHPLAAQTDFRFVCEEPLNPTRERRLSPSSRVRRMCSGRRRPLGCKYNHGCVVGKAAKRQVCGGCYGNQG